jgi:methyl-accepting chemotaxis protein
MSGPNPKGGAVGRWAARLRFAGGFRPSVTGLLFTMAGLAVAAVAISGRLAAGGIQRLAEQQGSLDASARVAMWGGQMVSALNELSARQSAILAARTMAEIERLDDGRESRARFEQALVKLGELREDLGDVDLPVDEIESDFRAFAVADASLLDQASRLAASREELTARADSLSSHTETATQLAQGLQGKVTLAAKRVERKVRRLLRDDGLLGDSAKLGELVDRTREAMTGTGAALVKEAAGVDEGIRTLESLGKDILLTENPDLLVSLADNRIVQAVNDVDGHLASLRTQTRSDTELTALVDEIEAEFEWIRDALSGNDRSMIARRLSALEARDALAGACDELARQGGRIQTRLADTHATLEGITLAASGAVQEAERSVRARIRSAVVAVGLGMVVSGGLIAFLVVVPLRRAARAMREIGQGGGDLTQRLRDSWVREISALTTGFNQFTEKLAELVREVVGNMNELSEMAKRNQTTVDRNVSELESQTEGSNQVAGATTELTATIREVAKSGSAAAEGAEKAARSAGQGREVVSSATREIEGMAGKVSEVATTVHELAAQSEIVGNIVDVIQAIAKQTNLLSLNATIEAKRAGQHGRGFAVVASEVRNLAIQTRESTQEIQTIIRNLQDDAKAAEGVARQGDESARSCLEQTREVGRTFEEIADSVESINSLNMHIASATEQQAATTEQIQANIVGVSDQAKTVLAGAQEISQTGLALDELSARVRNLMGRFRV